MFVRTARKELEGVEIDGIIIYHGVSGRVATSGLIRTWVQAVV